MLHVIIPNGLTHIKLSAVIISHSVFPFQCDSLHIRRLWLCFVLQITYHGSVTQENGPVHHLASVSPWISCVMEHTTVLRERMKPTPLLDTTAVSIKIAFK